MTILRDDFLDKYRLNVQSNGTIMCHFVEGSVYFRNFPDSKQIKFPNGQMALAKVFLFDEEGVCESCGFQYSDLEQDMYGKSLVEQTVH